MNIGTFVTVSGHSGYGVSKESVRQIEVAALKKMKKALTDEYEACKLESV